MQNHSRASARPGISVGLKIAVVAVGALVLGACSSSATSSTSPAAAAKPGTQGRPLASGSISSVSSSSMVVQNARTGNSITVDWSSSTTFNQTVTVSASDLAIGDCAQVLGASASSGPAVARTVSVSMPTSAGCTRPSGVSGRPFGGGGGGGGGGFGGGAPSFTSAFGSVISVENGTLTVKGTSSSGSTTTTFSYESTTTFTKVQSAKASSVSSGQCATAFGSSSSSGVVAASAISLRPAGPNGCSEFGGGGFGGGGLQA